MKTKPKILRSLIASSLLMLAALGAQATCLTPPSGLVNWWRGESNTLDSIASNHGIPYGNLGYAAGEVGYAFNLNNNIQSIDIPYDPAMVHSNYTMEAWIKPTAQPDNGENQGIIFGQPYGVGTLMIRGGTTGVNVLLLFDTPSAYWEVVTTNEIPLNTFTHVVGTWNGTTLKMYINGQLVRQNTPGVSPASSTRDFVIGGLHTGPGTAAEFFEGVIDEVSYYNRALSAGEIDDLYDAGSSGKCAPPVCVPPPANMRNWWRGESNTLDSISSNDGIAYANLGYTAGKVGYAFNLVTNTQSIDIPYDSAMVHSNYTMEAWIKPTAQPDNLENQGIIFGQPYGVGTLMIRGGGSGVNVLLLFDTPYNYWEAVTTNEIPLNQFTHVVGTWNGTTLKIYVNGQLAGQNTPGVSPATSTRDFVIGGLHNTSGPASEFFEGVIDEVSYYDRALSAGEITGLYNADTEGKCLPPVCLPPPVTLGNWWRGESNTLDSISSNDGTSYANLGYTLGVVGLAFNLTTNTQSIDIPYDPTMVHATYTMEAWIKPTAQPDNLENQGIIFGQPYGVGTMMIRGGGSGVNVLLLFDTPYEYWEVVSGNEIPLNQFTHVVGTWDGTKLKIYVNGLLAGQNTPYASPDTSTRDFVIGGLHNTSGPASEFFQGVIDEVSYYDGAMSAADVAALYSASSEGKCPPTCVAPPSGLLHWWRAETNTLDSVGNNHGIGYNGLGYLTGEVGYAFNFAINDQSIDIPYTNSLVYSNYSMEAWIKPTAQPDNLENQGIIFGQPYGVGTMMIRGGDTGVSPLLLFDTPNNYWEAVSASEIPLNKFAHVVGTWNGATLKIYVNGQLAGQNTPGVSPATSTRDFVIGGLHNTSGPASEFFEGLIDEVSYYNRALSAGEITDLFNAHHEGKCH